MDMLIRGLIAGAVVGIPLGMAASVTVQNTIKYGFRKAIVTGFGSSIAYLIYACISALIVAFFGHYIVQVKTPVFITGGVLLVINGLITVIKKNKDFEVDNSSESNFMNLVIGFMVGFTRPIIILEFVCMYIYCGIEYLTFKEAEMLLTGTYIGVFAWWLLVDFVVKLISIKKELRNMGVYNRIFGVIILAVGVFIIVMERIG